MNLRNFKKSNWLSKLKFLPHIFTTFERTLILAASVLLIAALFYRQAKTEKKSEPNLIEFDNQIIFHDSLVKYPMNINTTSVELLELVPEIGKNIANKIDSLRKHKPIKKLEDLLVVKGIGETKLQRMKYYLTCNDSVKEIPK